MNEPHIHPTSSSLARAAADLFVRLCDRALATQGRFVVALAGGSTPREAYQLLATEEYASEIDWSYVYIFWGDERCVPADHAESNHHMAREALLNHIPIPVSNIYRIPGELAPQQAADAYEHTLRDFFKRRVGSTQARFDLVLLGLGADAHTASLFPWSPAVHERTRWAMAVAHPQTGQARITLTPPALNAGATVAFLVSGEDKAAAVKRVLTEPPQPDVLPAQIIQPEHGQLLWLLDNAAASQL